jgi:lipid-binding SYLF domain-containing protein
MRAAILSYSRSRGLFAGADVKGVVLRPEDDLNIAVYNKTARELLSDDVSKARAPESSLKSFPETIGRYAVAPSENR